jgi:two-component system, LytTR family, sensor kinase
MFANPIIKSYRAVLQYLSIWAVTAVLMFVILNAFFDVPANVLQADIFFQNLLFGAMLLGLWYPVIALNPQTQSKLSLLFNHIFLGLFVGFIWVTVCHAFLRTFFAQNGLESYLNVMLPFKLTFALFAYLVFVISVNFFRYYQSYLEKKNIEAGLYKAIKEAELGLLRSQMNPHFIFNSLNSISSLTIIDPEKAQEMVILLSDFLRYTVSYSQTQTVTLAKELEMCKAYLEIEKIRFGEKLNLEWHVAPDTEHLQVPSIMLQTLFENAIKHSIYDSLKPETIVFCSALINNRLDIKLTNSFDTNRNPTTGTGTGLKNVKERLKLIYDRQAIFEASVQENVFIVWVNLPFL